MKLGRLNHIGVATPSIADSVAYYREVMAVEVSEPFDMPKQGVKVCFIGHMRALEPILIHIIRTW